jgi:hypothetical protein
MSPEGRALLERTKSSGLMRSPMLFDVLATLEHDMQEALKKKTVSLADWTNWLKKGEQQRAAFVQALFLLIAAGGFTSEDVAKLRKELQNVTPSRRRPAKLVSEPAPRQTRGLF